MNPLPSVLRRLLFSSSLIAAAPLALGMTSPAFAHDHDAPNVVASIKPVHSIASAIMKDIGEPVLLVDGASSPHTYSLRPSEARALNEADLVIYVSHTLEGFLSKPLESLSGDSHQLELISAPDLTLFDFREGGAWDAHMHDHGGHDDHDEHADHDDHEDHEGHDHDDHDHEEHAHEDHDHDEHGHEEHAHDEHDHDEHAHDDHDHDHDHAEHDGADPHIWMSLENGAAIAKAITAELSEIDPEHAENYQANLQTLLASFAELGNDLKAKVAPIQDKPYIVFHDAYQYLEAGFGLNAVGSITVSPDQKPGAKRLHEIEEKIHDTGAVCIFAEPQFQPAIVEAIVSDTGIRGGTLDPVGANIAAGPTAYQEIIAKSVDALVDCLGKDS
ncbi:zinc ABC transporter substrate-binding protein [Thalassospira sp.]|uniref:zinc ABC transporter substrate-binding protein n=1 Tax=Thalassospira sp. TaxID=1912094 RepID=UPI003AA81469